MSISFPSDLLQKRAYFCKIDALAPVQTADINVSDPNNSRIRIDAPRDEYGREMNRRIISSIYLPIPVELTQGNQEHTIDTSANLLGMFKGLAETASGIGNATLAAANRSINIGHYVVYVAPEFKKIQFSWTFIPRNPKDSDFLSYICLWLQYFSSPSSGPISSDISGQDVGDTGQSIANAFRSLDAFVRSLDAFGSAVGSAGLDAIDAVTFEYPNEFRITFLYQDGDNEPLDIIMPPLKTGFISNLEIKHFDEEGSPTAFFRDSRYPVATTINFTLQENELNVKSDYARAWFEARFRVENGRDVTPLGEPITNGGE